jgi:hypothetical protein
LHYHYNVNIISFEQAPRNDSVPRFYHDNKMLDARLSFLMSYEVLSCEPVVVESAAGIGNAHYFQRWVLPAHNASSVTKSQVRKL